MNQYETTCNFMIKKFDSRLINSINLKRQHSQNFSTDPSGRSQTSCGTGPVTFSGLDDRSSTSDLSLLEQKTENANLHTRLRASESETKRAKVDFEGTVETLKIENESLKQDVETMASQQQKNKLTMQRLEEECDRQRSAIIEMKAERDARVLKLSRTNTDRESELEKTIDNLRTELQEKMNEIMQLRQRHTVCINELTNVRAQVDAKTNQVEQWTEFMQDKEEELKNAEKYKGQVELLKEELKRIADTKIYVECMKSKLDSFPYLEKENIQLRTENEKLKHTHENIYMLQEHNRELNLKLTRYETNMNRIVVLEMQRDELKASLQKWEQQVRNPDDLFRQLSRLQKENSILTESNGKLQASLKVTLRDLGDVTSRLDSTTKQQQSCDTRVAEIEKENSRLTRRLRLVSQERDVIKNLLGNFESEMTSTFDNQSMERIAKLEDLLSKYKVELEIQSNEIDRLLGGKPLERRPCEQCQKRENTTGNSSQCEISQTDRKLIAELRDHITELEGHVEKMNEEKEALELRLEMRNLQGDYDPRTTKVLHFEMNPADKAAQDRGQEVKMLRLDNEKLRRRVEVLEERVKSLRDGLHNVSTIGNITAVVDERLHDQPDPLTEIEELREKLKRQELRHDRLMEVFEEKSGNMRDACSMILGFNVDVKQDGGFKVTSVYADDVSEYLLFRRAGQNIELIMENDFPNTLEKDIEFYAERHNCIPGLMSHLTLQYFQRTTMLE